MSFAFGSAPARADEVTDVVRLTRAGQYAEALTVADAVLAKKPRDAQMRFLKGVALAQNNRSAEAISVFTRLTEEFPAMPEPYNNLAVLYAAAGQYEKARVTLDKAIRSSPAYSTAYDNLGNIHARLASQAYDKALQIEPRSTDTRAQLALMPNLNTSGATFAVPGATAVAAAPSAPAAAPAKPSAPAKPAPAAVAAPQPAAVAPAKPAAPVAAPPTQVASATPAAPSAPVLSAAALKAKEREEARVAQLAAREEAKAKAKQAAEEANAKAKLAAEEARNKARLAAEEAKNKARLAAEEVKAKAKLAALEEEKKAARLAAENAPVIGVVNAWAKEWSARDVNGYLSHYSPEFDTPPGVSYKAWADERRARIVDKGHIDVKVEAPQVDIDGNTATVKFRQTYVSDRLTVRSRKTLVLVKQKGKWLIQQERSGG